MHVVEPPRLTYFDNTIFLADGLHLEMRKVIFVNSIHGVLMKILQKAHT